MLSRSRCETGSVLFFASWAQGVGSILTAVCKFIPPSRPLVPAPVGQLAVGVGKYVLASLFFPLSAPRMCTAFVFVDVGVGYNLTAVANPSPLVADNPLRLWFP